MSDNLWQHGSIREFCDLPMPIIMFNKDENYAVIRLEEVRHLSPFTLLACRVSTFLAPGPALLLR